MARSLYVFASIGDNYLVWRLLNWIFGSNEASLCMLWSFEPCCGVSWAPRWGEKQRKTKTIRSVILTSIKWRNRRESNCRRRVINWKAKSDFWFRSDLSMSLLACNFLIEISICLLSSDKIEWWVTFPRTERTMKEVIKISKRSEEVFLRQRSSIFLLVHAHRHPDSRLCWCSPRWIYTKKLHQTSRWCLYGHQL